MKSYLFFNLRKVWTQNAKTQDNKLPLVLFVMLHLAIHCKHYLKIQSSGENEERPLENAHLSGFTRYGFESNVL